MIGFGFYGKLSPGARELAAQIVVVRVGLGTGEAQVIAYDRYPEDGWASRAVVDAATRGRAGLENPRNIELHTAPKHPQKRIVFVVDGPAPAVSARVAQEIGSVSAHRPAIAVNGPTRGDRNIVGECRVEQMKNALIPNGSAEAGKVVTHQAPAEDGHALCTVVKRAATVESRFVILKDAPIHGQASKVLNRAAGLVGSIEPAQGALDQGEVAFVNDSTGDSLVAKDNPLAR